MNLAVNGAIAWLAVGGKSTIPLVASPIPGPSVITDTCLTLFLLPLFACSLVTIAVWKDRCRGMLEPVTPPGIPPAVLRGLGRNCVLRGAIFGAAALIVLGPPVVAILLALDADSFSASGFIIYKTLFAVVLGAIVTPAAALCAMAGRPEPRHRVPRKRAVVRRRKASARRR